ncbi:MAG: quercetin dioxygenase-like cupin family protein [Woeseiaceae bacterium]|jgi:quercetin dioxygenase-like cupin family protein|tara:strand:+ start:63204 stop:63704 length:501 start_codon:yes stop_codon:yes gene_type:complete
MKFNKSNNCLFFVSLVFLLLVACSESEKTKVNVVPEYEFQSSGTRQFEWDDEKNVGWIKVLLEEANFKDTKVEVAEIYFPPGYQDIAHMHELELLYVLEGRLDHIVNGKSHILMPGMLGIVTKPDLVVHRSDSDDGARVLAIWPHGKEIKALEEEELREISLIVSR